MSDAMPERPRLIKIGPVSLANATTIIASIPVGDYTRASIQSQDGDGSSYWATAQVGVKWGNTPDRTPVDFASARNLTGPNDVYLDIDISSIAYLFLVVDNAEAGVKGEFHICLRDTRGV